MQTRTSTRWHHTFARLSNSLQVWRYQTVGRTRSTVSSDIPQVRGKRTQPRGKLLHHPVKSMTHTPCNPSVPLPGVDPRDTHEGTSTHIQECSHAHHCSSESQTKCTQRTAKVGQIHSVYSHNGNLHSNKIHELQLHTQRGYISNIKLREKAKKKQNSQYDANYIVFKKDKTYLYKDKNKY